MASTPEIDVHAKDPNGETHQTVRDASPAVVVETTVEDDTGSEPKSKDIEAKPEEARVTETPGLIIEDSIEEDKKPSLIDKVKGKISKVIGHDHAGKAEQVLDPRLSYEVAATASAESGAVPAVKEA